MKLLKENIRGNICNIGVGDKFLDTTLKAHSMKENLVNYILSKLKMFALQKTLLKEWEKIFSNNISDKGLLTNNFYIPIFKRGKRF